MLQKLYYIGPQFRRERPQKGRYRQFFQIGAEVIGPPQRRVRKSPLRDAEVLEMLATLLDELGITGWRLISTRSAPRTTARATSRHCGSARPGQAQMCEDCQRRAETNPLRVLDCKVPEDQPIIDALPQIGDSLDEASRAHFAAGLAALDACGVPYERNHRLVRGLDYYTRTTFEFTARRASARRTRCSAAAATTGSERDARRPQGPGYRLRHRRRPPRADLAGAGRSATEDARRLHRTHGRGEECDGAWTGA